MIHGSITFLTPFASQSRRCIQPTTLLNITHINMHTMSHQFQRHTMFPSKCMLECVLPHSRYTLRYALTSFHLCNTVESPQTILELLPDPNTIPRHVHSEDPRIDSSVYAPSLPRCHVSQVIKQVWGFAGAMQSDGRDFSVSPAPTCPLKTNSASPNHLQPRKPSGPRPTSLRV